MAVKKRKPLAKAAPVKNRTVFVFEVSAEETDTDKPVWVQVAKAGTFKGYDGGNVEFTFDKPLFEKVVANARRHPSYSAGPDGFGTKPLLAWDFHHASELHPANVAAGGAPAQGWTLDFEVRDGADGTAQLWALTQWLEPARTYIKEGRYRWASVSMQFDGVDAVTGEAIGPVITSIALTNQPFIEGMEPLVASRYYYDAANSAEQALEWMRGLFGLPALASAAEVGAQLAKLESMVGGATAIEGVDADELVGCVRSILGLPTLSTAGEVFTKARQVLTSETTIGASQNPASPLAASKDVRVESEIEDMDLKVLASKLGVHETDKAVDGRLTELLALEVAIGEIAKVLEADSKTVLAKADKAAKAAASLASILKACGLEDPTQALAKITESFAQVEAAAKAMPELEALRALAKKAEDAEVEADVAAAMNTRGLKDDGTKIALTMLRRSDKKTFEEKFPKIDPTKAHLTATVVASASGAEPGVAPAPTATVDSIDLSAYAGRTDVEKAMEYIKATNPNAKTYTLEQLFPLACEITKKNRAAIKARG